MSDPHFADVYFGNSPIIEIVEGEECHTIRTTLPGTEPENACGDDDLSLPVSKFFAPEKIGPGCEPTTERYVVVRKRPLIRFGTPLYVITAQLGLRQLRASQWNELGLAEHWYGKVIDAEIAALSPHDWYYLTPDGDLFRWNKGGADQPLGDLVAYVGKDVYLDPKRLLPPS